MAGSKQRQSPIDINPNASFLAPKQQPLRILYDPPRGTATIKNSGHGFEVDVENAGYEISGGPLNNKFRLKQFHFHWGEKDGCGSEHTVKGTPYSAEVHLVHWNTACKSFEMAMKNDGLAVVGVFLQVGCPHYEIQDIIECLPCIPQKGDKITFPDDFALMSLLPEGVGSTEYWTYPGSLTTPPFAECVTWIMYKKPIEISSEQLSDFRKLRDEHGGKLLNIYRQTQPMCHLSTALPLRYFELILMASRIAKKRKLYDTNNENSATAITDAKRKMTEALAVCCAVDLQPFNYFEGEGFLGFVQSLIEVGAKYGNINASDCLPSALTISQQVDDDCEKVKIAIKEELRSVNPIGLTCDFWEHKPTKQSHYIVKIRYLKDDTMKSRVLGIIPTEDETAEIFLGAFEGLLVYYGIDQKSIVVIDNARSDIDAFDRKYARIGCAAQGLNFALMHAFDNSAIVTNLMKAAKNLETFIKQNRLENELQTTIKQEVGDHYESKYKILGFIHSNISRLETLRANRPPLEKLLKNIDGNLLKHLVNTLNQFRKAREYLSQENQATFHRVLWYRAVLKQLCVYEFREESNVRLFKMNLLSAIERYYRISPCHVIATFLTPKYRSLRLATTDEKNTALTLLEKILHDEHQMHQEENKNDDSTRSNDIFDEFADDPGRDNDAMDDYHAYTKLKFRQVDLVLPFMEFWTRKKSLMPRLYKIASWLYAIPATSTSSKRDFGDAGISLIDRQCGMNPQEIGKCLLLRSNSDFTEIKL